MHKHEHHVSHAEKSSGKEGGCCGGVDSHESGKTEAKAAEMGKKPIPASPGSHAHPSRVADHGCGCGGKHK